MPRQARIDAPGALHHIIIRGIERKRIFQDDLDRDEFLSRIEHILPESKTGCYAWALLPNHAHILLRTGFVSIARIMRRLLTGYAIRHNHRHCRHGQLFLSEPEALRAGGRTGTPVKCGFKRNYFPAIFNQIGQKRSPDTSHLI